jgi:hypothetical protein
MEQQVRRGPGLIPKVDINRMPLAGPDFPSIFADSESLLVVGVYQVLKLVTSHRLAMAPHCTKKGLDAHPAGTVQLDANGLWLMP